MDRKTRRLVFFTALLGLVAVNFSWPWSATAQILDPILNPIEDILNGGGQQSNPATDYQAQVRQEFDRDYRCVTTQQYSKARYYGFPAGYFTGTVVKQLALRLTPCMLQNGINFNPVDLLLSVGFTSRNVNDAVVVVVYAGRKSGTASQPSSGSGKNRPGLPSPVPAVDGTFQIFKSNLPSCKPGNYRVAGSFDSSFTTFTLTQAGGAEGCFNSIPVQVFTASGLTDGGPPVNFESPVGPGGSRIVGAISRVYGSFASPIVYPDAKTTIGTLALNAQNTKVNKGISSIPGNPNEPAIQRLPDVPPPIETVRNEEITTDQQGVTTVRTIVYVDLANKATVEQVNAALAAVGGTIYSSKPGIPGITIAIPNTGAMDGLENAEQILATQPAVSMTARQIIYPTPPVSLTSPPSPPAKPDLIPIPLVMQGAVNAKGQPPAPLKACLENELCIAPVQFVSLFLGDDFGQGVNPDLNLEIVGDIKNSNEDHGYYVAGLMAARRGSRFGVTNGVVGVYPAEDQKIVGFSKHLKGFDDVILDRLSRTGTKSVINFSLGADWPYKVDRTKQTASVWAKRIRDRGLEDRVVITASSGNENDDSGGDAKVAGKARSEDNIQYTAAGLRDDLSNQETKRKCGEWYQRIGSILTSGDPCQDVIETVSIPKLRNTLVVGALHAQEGDYTKYSTRGETVRAIVDITNGDDHCKTSGGFPGLIHGNDVKCNFVGTSFAAPQVAGLAAYLWNQEPNLKASEVVRRIIENQTTFQKLDRTGNLEVDASGKPVMSKKDAINVRKTLTPPPEFPLKPGEKTSPTLNRPPVANNDSATTSRSVTINVLVNDSDPDGDRLTVTGVTNGRHGGAVINSDGTVTYSWAVRREETDSFTYTISDGKGGAATATVTVSLPSF